MEMRHQNTEAEISHIWLLNVLKKAERIPVEAVIQQI
jgi:hypothetical protein